VTNEDGSVTENTIQDQADIIFGEKYLRRRPFLVLSEVARPAAGVRTEKKGWMDEPGQLVRFEQPSIVDRVSTNHLKGASLIVDLLNRKIVKNRYSAMGTEEQFLAYYLEKYAEQITEGLRIWAQRSALEVARA
jgi:hypothetical protein